MPKRYSGLQKHGGKRPGAGRKPIPASEKINAREMAREATRKTTHGPDRIMRRVFQTEQDEAEMWSKLLNDKTPSIRLRALEALSRMAYPVPKARDEAASGSVTIIFKKESERPKSPAEPAANAQ